MQIFTSNFVKFSLDKLICIVLIYQLLWWLRRIFLGITFRPSYCFHLEVHHRNINYKLEPTYINPHI